ncbi:amidohydrolase family protein [Pseudobutyrivibrio xylanivorans]|uniref:adenosine deaminase n=1 Tax=Pseudobutyrivibrio xylanivorans DSM 14809 TaxID=1123012 RepID=A0A1M6B947_PSEXY|nr:adenosine deaminase [Pseudobutyrivibrio xylanivorans]SHI45274.1 Adenosine/AMP deaminase [Pseudobutyrivibrio xylanivorans DSM 14809]
MTYFTCFFLDKEKDIIVNLYKDLDRMLYILKTPNHGTGNLIRNIAKTCHLELTKDENEMLVIKGEIPCFIDGNNKESYIFSLNDMEIASISPDGTVDVKATIPAIAKTLMSQTKDFDLPVGKTIFKTFIRREYKFRADLHTHMNGNLTGDVLIALGISHQIRYPLYYVKKLDLKLTDAQWTKALEQREKVARQFVSSGLQGKYLDRRIDDNTFINFADLILNNLDNAEDNIVKIRGSLAVIKDGQAVFTNLEKVYLYRYVFCKGVEHEDKISISNKVEMIPDEDVKNTLQQMLRDKENPVYSTNTIFQDKLLWIARGYKKQGTYYAEISDTTLVKKYESIEMLRQVHAVMPSIYQETGVMIRFLAAMRRIPLTIIKDAVTPENYLEQNLEVLKATALDPYVAGCDFVGEEINDIIELKPAFKEIVKIAANDPSFVIRVHAGENDSQKDNIAHSIACVKESLAKGQPMPKMRLGHGLYTYSLNSKKGKEALKELKENNVVLEFQITSNVRLNNLNSLDKHPLKQYLKQGIRCVQGTDGAALYGTDAIEEELSLEKMLGLSDAELKLMREAEATIIEEGQKAYSDKKAAFAKLIGDRDLEDVLLEKMQTVKIAGKKTKGEVLLDANAELKEQISEITWDRFPVVLLGGSFNTESRSTKLSKNATKQIDELMELLSPDEVCFVIGHKLSGYEKYLLDHNDKGFRIYSFVPAVITKREADKIKKSGVKVRVSTESQGMGIYKSFNYEIFERRPSIVVAFDGNSAATNLIQEAKNGKGKSAIFVWANSKNLMQKAKSLHGYVYSFDSDNKLVDTIKELQSTIEQK